MRTIAVVLWVIFLIVSITGCGGGSGSGGGPGTPHATVTPSPDPSPDEPPAIVDTNTDDNDGNNEQVPVAEGISITFSKPLDPSTVNASTVYLVAEEDAASLVARNALRQTQVACTVDYDETTYTVTLTPTAPLDYNTTYTVVITTGVKDSEGNPLPEDYTLTFTTETDTVRPTVTSVVPVTAATAVPLNTSIAITFSEKVSPSTVVSPAENITMATSAGTPVTGSVAYNPVTKTASFTPADFLEANTQYTVTVSNVEDTQGNKMSGNYSSSFTTGVVTDDTRPVITSLCPSDGATDVALDSTIRIAFSEQMDPTMLTDDSFELSDPEGSWIELTYEYDVETMTMTITPLEPLLDNTVYTLEIESQMMDMAGNRIFDPDNDFGFPTWQTAATFTTVAVPDPEDSTPPEVVSVEISRDPVSGDPYLDTIILVTFSEDIDPDTVDLANFVLTPRDPGVSDYVRYSDMTHTVSFIPAPHLSANTSYTLTIDAGVTDKAGNPLAAPYVYTFDTGADAGLTESTYPTATFSVNEDETGVPINSQFTVDFSNNLEPYYLSRNTVFLNDSDDVRIPISLAYDLAAKRLTVTPLVPLEYHTEYTLLISWEVWDMEKDRSGGHTTVTFTTEDNAGSPTVLRSTTPTGSTDVPINSSFAVKFSDTMDSSTLNTWEGADNITLADSNGNTVAGSVYYEPKTKSAIFYSDENLLPCTTYTLTLGAGITDTAGTPLAEPYVVTFTTRSTTVDE